MILCREKSGDVCFNENIVSYERSTDTKIYFYSKLHG